MPLFPCPYVGCDQDPFKSFSKMDYHFRATHDTADYVEFRRGPYDLIKMTQSCDDCGFHFPSQEEYFDHFSFCIHYKLENTTGRRKRRSVKSLDEPKSKAARVELDEADDVDDPDEEDEPDYAEGGSADDSSDNFSGEDESFEPLSAPGPSRVSRSTPKINMIKTTPKLPSIPEEKRVPILVQKPKRPRSSRVTSTTHLFDKDLEQPNGMDDIPVDSDIRQSILDDHCFHCFWKDCDYKNTFKNILCHFRESHGHGYLSKLLFIRQP